MKIFMVVKEQGPDITVQIDPSDLLYRDKDRLLSLLSLLPIDASAQVLEIEIDENDLRADPAQNLHVTKITNANIIHCENLAKLLQQRQKITALYDEIYKFLSDFIAAKNQEFELASGKAQLANLELLTMAQRLFLSLTTDFLSHVFLKTLITERENFKSNLNLRDVNSSLKLWLDEIILKLTALLNEKSDYTEKEKNRRSVHFFAEQVSTNLSKEGKNQFSFKKSG